MHSPNVTLFSPVQGAAETAPPHAREAILRQLLPYDYRYASDSGLIDIFYYDDNYDGLLHTLAGSIEPREGGTWAATGFHHEPSAAIVWPPTQEAGDTVRRQTYVDRSHLSERTSEKRDSYKEYPGEPYAARVVVGGLAKYVLNRDAKTGESKLVPAKSTMYPKEYDPLAVMQAIRIARDTRDTTKDMRIEAHGRELIRTQGTVPLIDGKTPMKINLILEGGTGKVVSAYPVIGNRPGLMKLSEEEMWGHVLGA